VDAAGVAENDGKVAGALSHLQNVDFFIIYSSHKRIVKCCANWAAWSLDPANVKSLLIYDPKLTSFAVSG